MTGSQPFDSDLRLRDPVHQLAFLAMERDRTGRPELDGWLFGASTATLPATTRRGR